LSDNNSLCEIHNPIIFYLHKHTHRGSQLTRFKYRYLVLVLLYISNLGALEENSRYHFTNIGLEEGLSNRAVSSILRDSKGFMWFGTRNGLNRWDGKHMRIFHHNIFDSLSLPSPSVTALAEAPDGIIWIGSNDKGLASFDPRTELFNRYVHDSSDPRSLVDNNITVLKIDANGNLWVGTQNGLCRLDFESGNFTQYQHHPGTELSIPHNSITALEVDKKGMLWAGTELGWLCSYDPGLNGFKTVQNKRLSPIRAGTNIITDICVDPSNNTLWVSMFPLGLLNYSIAGGNVKSFGATSDDQHMVNKNAIYALDMDAKGDVWIASINGVTKFDPENESYQYFVPDNKDPNSIEGKEISSLMIDSQGIIWTASHSDGVDVCNPNQLRIQHFKASQNNELPLQIDRITGMDLDLENRLWMSGAPGGFQRIDLSTGEVKLFQTDDTDPGVWSMTYATKVMVDSHGRVWMGTYGAGLFRWEPISDRLEHYRNLPNNNSRQSNNTSYSLYETRDSTIWVGTQGGGLNRYRPESDDFEYIRHDPNDPTSLGSDKIFTMLEDRRGEIWIGTSDAGLDRLDRHSGKFQHYSVTKQSNSISSNIILTLYEDGHSNLWIGTRGGGLCLLDSARQDFTQINLGPNAGQIEIKGILEDAHGLLWMSSNMGILKYHPTQGLIGTFKQSDGVQGLEFNWDSCLKDANGFMYFGGLNGLNRFHPDSIALNKHIPNVVFTNLWINHERVNVRDKTGEQSVLPKAIEFLDTLNLSYRDKVLRFEFVALDYSNPQLNQYKYKLENFDPEWVEIGNQNEVTYTSLDPGWYTLRIKASNNDQVWNQEGTQLAIFIKPPFWQTLWFRILSALFMLVMFLLIMWLRTIRLRAQNKQLEILVRQRTEELKIEIEGRAKAKLEHLRRELLTKTMHLNDKQQIVEQVHADLELITKSNIENSVTSLKKVLRFLKSQLVGQTGWQDFELWFTEVHAGFFDALRERYSDLSETELKVCALLRLNLLSKDISKVMNIQSASVDTYRFRIRKKLNLQNEENLTTFLSQF